MKNAQVAHQFYYMVMSILTVPLCSGFELPRRYAKPLGHPQQPQSKEEVDRLCKAEIDGLFDGAADDPAPDTPLFNRICGQQSKQNNNRGHRACSWSSAQSRNDSDDGFAPAFLPSGITGGMHHSDPVQTYAESIPSSCPDTPDGLHIDPNKPSSALEDSSVGHLPPNLQDILDFLEDDVYECDAQ